MRIFGDIKYLNTSSPCTLSTLSPPLPRINFDLSFHFGPAFFDSINLGGKAIGKVHPATEPTATPDFDCWQLDSFLPKTCNTPRFIFLHLTSCWHNSLSAGASDLSASQLINISSACILVHVCRIIIIGLAKRLLAEERRACS